VNEALVALGWNETWSRGLTTHATGQTQVPARVIRQERSSFLLDTGSHTLRAETSGTLKHEEQTAVDRPIVGDWVLLAQDTEPHVTAIISQLLPRASVLLRRRPGERELQPLAANVDLALIVVGLDRPPDLKLLKSAVAMALAGAIEPVLVLNKIDLCTDFERELMLVRAHFPELTVLPLSTASQSGLDALQKRLTRGRTAVLLGPSGAGKSSLANQLLGSDVMKTGAVRSRNLEGKHTTTHRQLLRLPEGALLIDGPGLRDFRI